MSPFAPLDQELPENPGSVGVSPALPATGLSRRSSSVVNFHAVNQGRGPQDSPGGLPRLFSRISCMLRVRTHIHAYMHTHVAPSAPVPHDTHPHLSLPQLWPPRGPLSCVQPSSPTCYREQILLSPLQQPAPALWPYGPLTRPSWAPLCLGPLDHP